jgi:hypothetical protein
MSYKNQKLVLPYGGIVSEAKWGKISATISG